MTLKERTKQLKIDIPAVFIALKRKETPLLAKVLAGITIAYALSPIDLIPDFIPVLGYLDDVIILPALIALTIKLIPHEIFEQCRIQSESALKTPQQHKWYFAIPIVLVWGFLIWLIVKLVC